MATERDGRGASPQVRHYYEQRRVQRVQELRRSNAAQPRPGRRQEGPAAGEWTAVCTHAGAHPWWRCPDLPCEICGTTTDQHTDELCFK